MTFALSPVSRVQEVGARILAYIAAFTTLGISTTALDTSLKALEREDGTQVFPNGYTTTEAQYQRVFEKYGWIMEKTLALFEAVSATGEAGEIQNPEHLWSPGDLKVSMVRSTPTGWLLCDGSAVSRSTYAALFAAITITTAATHANGSPILTGIADTTGMQVGDFVSGVGIPAGAKILTVDSPTQITLDDNATAATPLTGNITVSPHGIGDGTTTFNVPDARGRALIGAGTGAGLTARLLGEQVGSETVTLAAANVPVKGVADGANTGHDATTGVSGQPLVGASAESTPTDVEIMGPSLGANVYIKT